MRNGILILAAAFSCLALAPFPPGTVRAAETAEPTIIQSDDLEVDEQSQATLPVEVASVPKNADAILEFTAWYQASRNAGFYAAMRVFWDGEEMEDLLDRPATFQVRIGANDTRDVDVRTGKYWQVPVLPDPEAARDPTQNYYISPDKVDVVRFRFRLPALTPGGHELIIRNNMRSNLNVSYDVFPTLVLRDVAIHWVAK